MLKTPKSKFLLKIKEEDDNCYLNECSICYDELNNNNKINTSCNHKFCVMCIKDFMITLSEKKFAKLNCPCCRQQITTISLLNKDEIQLLKEKFCKPNKRADFFEPIPSFLIYNDSVNYSYYFHVNIDEDFEMNEENRSTVLILFYFINYLGVCYLLSNTFNINLLLTITYVTLYVIVIYKIFYFICNK